MTEKIVIVSLKYAVALVSQRLGRFYSLMLHNYVCWFFWRSGGVLAPYVYEEDLQILSIVHN